MFQGKKSEMLVVVMENSVQCREDISHFVFFCPRGLCATLLGRQETFAVDEDLRCLLGVRKGKRNRLFNTSEQ